MTSKTVLITGASTGIGRATALEMSRQGYDVVAGVRSEKDAQKLTADSNGAVTAILLDVTKPESIEHATEFIKERTEGFGLYALINNAGVNYAAPFEYTEENQARMMMEVNFFGLYKLSQQLIPLLRFYRQNHPNGHKPKLINVGSVGSAIGLPWESFYHASKFAVFGLSESLRSELSKVGVDVTVIMPGGVRTEIFAKTGDMTAQTLKSLPENAPESYRASIHRFNSVASSIEKNATTSEVAAKRIVTILNKKRAPFKLLIGLDAKSLYYSVKFGPRAVWHWILGKV